MTKALAIVRLLLLLAFLSGGPATAECCCGTGREVCGMDMAPAEGFLAWSGAWGAVADTVWSAPVPPAKIEARTCGLSPGQQDCPCWRPMRPENRIAPSLSPASAPTLALAPETVRPAPPRAPALQKESLEPPPLRPPIEQVGWDYALFPLPPPFLV